MLLSPLNCTMPACYFKNPGPGISISTSWSGMQQHHTTCTWMMTRCTVMPLYKLCYAASRFKLRMHQCCIRGGHHSQQLAHVGVVFPSNQLMHLLWWSPSAMYLCWWSSHCSTTTYTDALSDLLQLALCGGARGGGL